MPQLLRACAEAEDPDLPPWRGFCPLVVAVVRRSAYLVLLLENLPAMAELVALCGASPGSRSNWHASRCCWMNCSTAPACTRRRTKGALESELRQQVARLAPDDLEAQMDALRYFKASHVLRVAASELVGRLPLMQVSDKLTWIAEVILEQVLAVAWADLTSKKYGEPQRPGTGSGFCIRLWQAGIELGYGSDLDLVFIPTAPTRGVTDGERSIDNTVFIPGSASA